MRHSFLDRYRQGTSLIHRLDPRLKFLATLAYVLAVTTTPPHAWPALALFAILALAAIAVAEVPLVAVSYTHLRAHETVLDLVCRRLLEKKK